MGWLIGIKKRWRKGATRVDRRRRAAIALLRNQPRRRKGPVPVKKIKGTKERRSEIQVY